MIKKGDKEKLEKCVFGNRKVKEIYLGHIKVWPEKENLSQFIIKEGDWKPGDVVLYSKPTGNKFAVEAKNVDKFHPKSFSPIGIVVIPQSHDVYKNGCAGVMSLKYMNGTTPETGTKLSLPLYQGYHSTTSIVSKFDSINSDSYYRCYFNHYGTITESPKNTVQGFFYRLLIPSNHLTFPTTEYPNDPRLNYGYFSTSTPYYWGISPYTKDDGPNPDFKAYTGNYFNGKEYQNVWLSLVTTSDWKTSPTIFNSSNQQGHYPPFMCAARYYTEGTNQGDWYIPSITEMIYTLPKRKEINYALDKVNNHFGNSLNTLINGAYGSANFSWQNFESYAVTPKINLGSGVLSQEYFNSASYYIAFIQLKSDIDTRTKYNITFNFNDNLQYIVVKIGADSYTIFKNETFKVLEGESISWEAIPKEGYRCTNAKGSIEYTQTNEIINFIAEEIQLFNITFVTDGTYSFRIYINDSGSISRTISTTTTISYESGTKLRYNIYTIESYMTFNPNEETFIVEENRIIKPDITYDIMDIACWDKTRGSISKVEPDELTNNPENYIPIGIIVIPSSHNVYGTRECGILALKYASCNTPDEGSANPSNIALPYYAGTTTPSSFNTVPNYNSITDRTIKSGTNGNIPNIITGANYPSFTDPGYYYPTNTAQKLLPSPYLEDGSRNPEYYSTSSPMSSSNALADFNGKSNCNTWMSTATAQSDWRTAATLMNQYGNGYSSSVHACWRYHTIGTNQGDWYLGACGEMGYAVSRTKKIKYTLNALKNLYKDLEIMNSTSLDASAVQVSTKFRYDQMRCVRLNDSTAANENVATYTQPAKTIPFTKMLL